jgi:serine/threonine-protein kinase
MADRLGPYTLDKRIGAGGMADVFLARGPMGLCVVKRPHPHLCANPEFVRMFLDEASLLAQLHHPGIAQIFDLGHVSGVYYLAMEYVPGFDLMTISLEHERHGELIAPELCARIVADAAAAMHYAHEAKGKNGQPLNLVHRDLSPHNILVSTKGVVKVIDFGVARASTATHRTRAGHVKGKYPYMAPEQVTGQAIDRRVDVYALGLVLYELLTNVRAIAGNGEVEQIQNAKHARIRPIEQLRPNTPVALRQILAGCLHPSPSGRYPTAEHLKNDLENFLQNQRHVVGQEDLLRLFRVVAAEVGHAAFAVEESPAHPTQLDPLPVPQPPSPNADEIGLAPTAPSLPSPVVSFLRDAPVEPVKLTPEHEVANREALASRAGVVGLEPTKATGRFGPEVESAAQAWRDRSPAPLSVAAPSTHFLPPSGLKPAASPRKSVGPVAALSAVGALLAVIVGGVVLWKAQQGEGELDAGIRLTVVMPEVDAGKPVEVDASAAVVAVVPEEDTEAADAGSPVQVAVLQVDASPRSTVIVDGRSWGSTPLQLELLAGTYIVTVKNLEQGFEQSQRITLAAGDKKSWFAASPKPGKGALEIFAPPFAAMFVDGKKETPVPVASKTLEVSEGTHRVDLVLEDSSLPQPRKKRRTVQVQAGATTKLEVNMMVDD